MRSITRFLIAACAALAPAAGACAGEIPETVAEKLLMPLGVTYLPPIQGTAVGSPDAGSVFVLGGEGQATFTVVSGRLPEGTVLRADGSLAGPVSAPGTYEARVRVTDRASQVRDVDLRIEVAESLR
jgi:hypothetical protein